MNHRSVSLPGNGAAAEEGFRAAVCLHGHTMHSEECLWFLPRYLHQVPGISQIVRQYENHSVDFARAYWTPPLTPASALEVERQQIASLGLRAMVSLTDHDSIEAGMALQVTADPRAVPVSVEWTAPYERTILHLGIHNLPPGKAREWMAVFAAYTAAPRESQLPEILGQLDGLHEVLIVLNHPFWLEEGVEESVHRPALDRFLRESMAWIHALEVNGTRGWKENAAVVELARGAGLPVISGGDRHACEPAACLNLTDAETFAEFVAEIRSGLSTLLFMPHYTEPMAIRVLEAAWDILRPYPEYPGREHWTDRIFYRGEDGTARPLAALWRDRLPWIVRPVTPVVQFLTAPGVRGALRLLLSRRAEALP